MKKGTQKRISLVLVVSMLMMLIPAGLTLSVSAATGTITEINVNPNRPTANTGSTQIKVASPVFGNGNFSYGDRTTMTVAHLGAKLKNLTQIYTPIADSTRANPTNPPSVNTAMNNFLESTQEYFNFKADAPGAVYVLSNTNLHNVQSAGYYNNYASWIIAANNIYPANHPTISDWKKVPIDYETNAPYYLTKYQWSSDTLCSSGSPKTADLSLQLTNQNGTNNSGIIKYPYAYKKYFAANTNVSIPVVGNYKSNENIIVLVDWNDVEQDSTKLKTFKYTIPGGSATAVPGYSVTDEGGNYNVEVPKGTTTVNVEAVAEAFLATTEKTPADGVVDVSSGSGTYTITVHSGALSHTYTINFTVSPYTYNAKLSSLTYTPNGGAPAAVTGFLSTDNGGEYRIMLEEGKRSVSIEGIVADSLATITYDKTVLDKLPGTIVATVTSDGGTQSKYKVHFDLPGYVINDTMDSHGDIGSIVALKKGDWDYVAAVKDAGGNYVEWVGVGTDPKDSTNLVASYQFDGVSARYPSMKKNAVFTGPMVISGEALMEGPVSNYIELRKYNGGGTDSAGQVLRFGGDGYIYFGGTTINEKTAYKWTANEWIKYSLIIRPDVDTLSMTNCPATIIISGAVTDEAGNPTVVNLTKNINLTKTDYLSATNNHQINVIYNSGYSANKPASLYQDNLKIYYPVAGEISIPNNTDVSVTGPSEVLMSKYEFSPVTMIPQNIVVTTGPESTPVAVSAVKYDTRLDRFGLEFYQTLAENTTYNVSLNGATDVAGNPLTGTATFTTGTADPITSISIDVNGSLEQSFGATKKVVFTANTVPYDNVDISDVVWYLDGVQVGTGRSYEFTPDQIDSYVISASVNGTALTAEPKTLTVGKGTRVAPAPVATATVNTITVTPVDGAEYGILAKDSTDTVVYSSSNEFTGLSPETEYTVYLRLAENELYFVSEPATLDVTTEAASFGDINADGVITIADVVMVAEIAVGNTNFTADQILRANVSSTTDMTVDIVDVIMILERVVGTNTAPFPVEII